MTYIEDEQVVTLEQLEQWLEQEYPNRMRFDDAPEFDRVKVLGATELAVYILGMLKDNREESIK